VAVPRPRPQDRQAVLGLNRLSRERGGRNMSHTRRTASTGTAPARAASTWRR